MVLINIPQWEVTLGIFRSDHYSTIIPSTYGTVLNALILYGSSYRLAKDNFSLKAFLYSGLLLLTVSLVEGLLDIAYYTIHYKTINTAILFEALWGQLLMNTVFFYVPSIIYGLVKSLLKKEPIAEKKLKIQIKDGNQMVYIDPLSLTHVESDGNYCIYHAVKKHLVRQSLIQAKDSLPKYFLRCHKSFIVNSKRIDKVTYNDLAIGAHTIPVGRKYRADLKSYLNQVMNL